MPPVPKVPADASASVPKVPANTSTLISEGPVDAFVPVPEDPANVFTFPITISLSHRKRSFLCQNLFTSVSDVLADVFTPSPAFLAAPPALFSSLHHNPCQQQQQRFLCLQQQQQMMFLRPQILRHLLESEQSIRPPWSPTARSVLPDSPLLVPWSTSRAPEPLASQAPSLLSFIPTTAGLKASFDELRGRPTELHTFFGPFSACPVMFEDVEFLVVPQLFHLIL
ncbi:hypothetical protein CRENBAI_020586 [Crenichthys baileyi]|uniref:Uncharacterized protein n=1 Tax=Crenichthys baileyi TaxID=28760 RepID=A0AAV9S4M3_9TELE